MSWLVLGFTAEQVTVAWQDSRLAEACVRRVRALGQPPPEDVYQAAGDEPFLVCWYVGAAAARILDEAAVEWRRFVVDMRTELPPEAAPALREPTSPPSSDPDVEP